MGDTGEKASAAARANLHRHFVGKGKPPPPQVHVLCRAGNWRGRIRWLGIIAFLFPVLPNQCASTPGGYDPALVVADENGRARNPRAQVQTRGQLRCCAAVIPKMTGAGANGRRAAGTQSGAGLHHHTIRGAGDCILSSLARSLTSIHGAAAEAKRRNWDGLLSDSRYTAFLIGPAPA